MFTLTDEEKKLLASKRKNMQIVWVPLPILDEIAQIAEKLHLALNQTIIVLTIRALRGFPQQTNNGSAHFLCPVSFNEELKVAIANRVTEETRGIL